MIQYEVDKGCEILVKNIATSPLLNNNIASEIEQKKNVLSREINELFKDSITKMGNIMSEHLSIPPNVTLSTDQKKLKNIDESEDELQHTHDEHLRTFMKVGIFCHISILTWYLCQFANWLQQILILFYDFEFTIVGAKLFNYYRSYIGELGQEH